jgi:hypothetical protein
MKGPSSYTYALNVYRYFMDWSEELVEICEFFPVVSSKLIILMYFGILVVLVERKGVS